MFESDGGFILHPWLGGGDSYLRSPRGSSVALTLATVVLSVLSLASSSRFFGGDSMDEEEEEKIVKGDDVIVELEATLEDLYMGGSLKVWREKNVIKPAPGKRNCNCRNEVHHRQIGLGMFQQYTEQVCDQCSNVKFEREGYQVTVDIEKGMKDGEEVVFYEDGEPKIDGEPGDLKFRIHTAPHERFVREGNNLHANVTITLAQALIGFDKTIKHLDDHLVEVGSKGITKPKEVRKFKGEGMPPHMSNKKGDLYIKYEVLFPTSLTVDQKTDQGDLQLRLKKYMKFVAIFLSIGF